MVRDKTISVHVSGSLKREIDDMAHEAGVTTSAYLRRMMKQHVTEEKVDEIAYEVRAEERLEEITTLAKDEIRREIEEFNETAKAVQELTARAGVYSVANFELQARQHTGGQPKTALATGSRRLRENLLEGLDLDIDPEEIPETDGENDAPGGRPWETDEE